MCGNLAPVTVSTAVTGADYNLEVTANHALFSPNLFGIDETSARKSQMSSICHVTVVSNSGHTRCARCWQILVVGRELALNIAYHFDVVLEAYHCARNR